MRCKYCNTELVETQVGNYTAWSCVSKACKDQRWPTGRSCVGPLPESRRQTACTEKADRHGTRDPFSSSRCDGSYPHDMPKEDTELTHVGPGTPCGEYFHRYGRPICLVDPGWS